MPDPHAAQLPTPLWVLLTVPALTGLFAGLVANVLAQYNARGAAKRDENARRIADRLGFLDPLARGAESLGWKLKTIREKLETPRDGKGGLQWMLDQFHLAKHPAGTATDHGWWCNGEGFFATSTIYATAVFFAHSTRVRREYVGEEQLVKLLDKVSDAFASDSGIYHLVQDSVGQCTPAPSGRELSYREFCTRLYEEEERLWFLGVLDYYRQIDKKPPSELNAVRSALSDLLDYLSKTAKLNARNPFAAG